MKRTKRGSGDLLSYFEKREDAESARKKLKRKHFHHIILLSKVVDENLRPDWIPFRSRRKKYRTKGRVSNGTIFSLLPGESALLIHAPIDTLQLAVALLREGNDIPPAVFILHNKVVAVPEEKPVVSEVPFSSSLVLEHAKRLGIEHRIEYRPHKSHELLARLDRAYQLIRETCTELSVAYRLEQGTSATAEWILDNEYIIASNVRDIRINLPTAFNRRLPTLTAGKAKGLPRIYDLARKMISDTELRLDKDNIIAFIDAYQSSCPLTIGELWAIPQMLRIALIESVSDLALKASTELRERESADFWAHRLIKANRQGSDQLFSILAKLALMFPNPSPYFASQLIEQLYDEETILVFVQEWLEHIYHQPLSGIGLREQNRQAKDQISISNAFMSLRQLALLDWRKIFESLSQVERLLRGEPCGIYPGMDFDTRDRYRRVIEELSRASDQTEDQVARQALALAQDAMNAPPGTDERRRHVGTYLIGEGRKELVQRLHCGENWRYRLLHLIYRHSSAVFFCSLGIFVVGLLLLVTLAVPGSLAIELCLLLALLLIIPASQLALEVLNYLAARVLPPRVLPKMDFEVSGIPDQFRTLVVVPVLLGNAQSIRSEVEKLEVRYLANRDKNLIFGLFTDYQDAGEEHQKTDVELLHVAVESTESLNSHYGSGHFFLFHREREWCESEQKFIGWERKRGKLEELNALLAGTRPEGAPDIVYVGERDALADVRFVITLDSDTQLPAGTARRMVETLAHPLNQPRFDGTGKVLAGSYTIIQPRVSSSLSSTSTSLFGRLFADAAGIDPYTKAISDLYQDLTGEGSYYGKGIYDVRAFNRVLDGKFPEERLLSHDLIEGAYVRVGLASDIELYDEFPLSYGKAADRQHRWIRGDWQIAQWILSRVPGQGKNLERNPLSRFDRWKLFDNLRRSLLPIANMVMLFASWVTSPQAGLIASLVVFMQLFSRSFILCFTMLTTRRGIVDFPPSGAARDLLRALVDASLLPYQAILATDAILRTEYRRHISHRNMLQWDSAQTLSEAGCERQAPILALKMVLVSIASVITGLALSLWAPANLICAGPWLAAWFFSPLTVWLLDLSLPERKRRLELNSGDTKFLREISRHTWRYFDDFVNADSSWLPPDNYQISPRKELALRTSPTNIGLWMVSALSAHDFGYLSLDQVVLRLTSTMQTIGSLERFRGHLFNWYDVRTGAPLEPRYISTVDSGNLLGSLWTLNQGLGGLFEQPLLDERAVYGLQDTARVLRGVLGHGKFTGEWGRALSTLMKEWESLPSRFTDTLELLRKQRREIEALVGEERLHAEADTEKAYWTTQIEKHLSAWLNIVDRYLLWMEILAEKSEEEITTLGPKVAEAVQRGISHAPSLIDLANGRIGCIEVLKEARNAIPLQDGPMCAWMDRVAEAFSKSRWLAREMLGKGQRLISDSFAISEQMDMRFLYDPGRRLFAIGYDVTEGRRNDSFYDLLASESRLGSFVAIARGDVPFEHWFALSRPYAKLGHRRVLLSWTGTMFEYLMPSLFQKSFPNTILGEAARGALAAQMEYAHRNRVPWGISESAFADMDINKTYQYRAFGVPGLRLKHEPEEKIVIAPYATFLALELAPRESLGNLRYLATLGLFNGDGFYESIDFSRQPSQNSERGVVIQTYMAHHQGMSFIALTNFLFDGSIRRWFGADARVRSVEALLQERIPHLPASHYISMREPEQSVRNTIEVIAPSVSKFETAHTRTPKTQLLSNGRYSVMVTNAGGGYSQWGTQEITRWRSDPTRDLWGTFFYIHELESGELWSPTYWPVGIKGEDCSASFALDRAIFQRFFNGVHAREEIVVSPEDDVEIRRVTLTNRSLRIRHLDCSSYIELSMAPHAADRQHPAFNKLFIQTKALPLQHALLAFRRPREDDAPTVYVAHRFTHEADDKEVMRFETDRARFIGRGGSLANPPGAVREPQNSEGSILDPILSLRTTISLLPGQRVTLSLVIAAGETQEQVIGLMDKYANPHAIDRAMDFAWAAAQLELRMLRIQPDDARRFQQLASHLLYPNRMLRSPAGKIEENTQGQAGLWRYGISGDLPIALVTIGEIRDIGLVIQMLQAHTYWRMHGLMADLVIIVEEVGSYERPLYERLETLIQAHSTNTGRDKPGGVFLRSEDQIPEADLTLLWAVSNIVFVSARGTLAWQIGIPGEIYDQQEKPTRKNTVQDPVTPLPSLELTYFNGLGGFTPDGREYVIDLGTGVNTPAPWINVIANPNFGTLVSERGSGFTWSGNSQRNRLTAWANDPVMDPASEAIYIRDEMTGLRWTPTASPIRGKAPYRVRHGAGYSVFEHNSNGIDQELTIFVPMDKDGGRPVKLQILRLTNSSARQRTLSLTYYVEWVLGEHSETSRMHVVTDWDDEMQAITAKNRVHPEYRERVSFAAISLNVDSYCGDRTSFLGRNGSMESAAAMEYAALSNKTGAGYDPCAALRGCFELAPGESTEIACILGQAESREAALALVLAYRKTTALETALERTKTWWNDLLGMLEIHTPELAADFLVNRWLLYQDLSCRVWGRSALYQSGGAFGFRDQLQDVMALLYVSPDIARNHILLAASRQFKEGDVQHWWHPPLGAGIRSRISDDLLWLPYVVAQYLRVTGDVGILNTQVSFLDGPELKDYQREAFFTPTIATEQASLFEHCRRAVQRGLTEGPHGLPLMGTGDWNDGMNLVGIDGKGESVWLAWFLVDVLCGMSEMSEALGLLDLRSDYLKKREALIGRIENSAWDGRWYLRAIFDDGTPLGSSANLEGRIDSLPQSWAFLSGGDTDHSRIALESAWKALVNEDEGLVLLFTPPFDKSIPSPGYIQAYPPGVRENGGQYTHAALWLAMAMARRKDGTHLGQLLHMLNPIEQTRTPEAVRRYSVEPYAAVADVYRLAGHIGQGGWSWYTGSAAWMYRTWIEEVLGLKLRGAKMTLYPVIPGWWKGFHMDYRHGEAHYEIQVENPEHCESGVLWVEMDGVRLEDCNIPLEKGLGNHKIVVRMGNILSAS